MIFSLSATRRKFLLIGAGIASAFGVTLRANSQSPDRNPYEPRQSSPPPTPQPSPQPSGRPDGFIPVVGPTSILERNGRVLTPQVLIVRNSANNELVGVSPACTHRGCTIDWKQDSQTFMCPCHGAEYGADGKVLKGPADRNLQGFEVKIEENLFLIKPV